MNIAALEVNKPEAQLTTEEIRTNNFVADILHDLKTVTSVAGEMPELAEQQDRLAEMLPARPDLAKRVIGDDGLIAWAGRRYSKTAVELDEIIKKYPDLSHRDGELIPEFITLKKVIADLVACCDNLQESKELPPGRQI